MGIITNLLNKTASIYRRTRTTDGQGGWTIGYSLVETASVRVSPKSGSEQEIAATDDRKITHSVYSLTTADIERGDKLVIGDLSLEVLDVKEPSLLGHHYEIDCVEWQKEVSA